MPDTISEAMLDGVLLVLLRYAALAGEAAQILNVERERAAVQPYPADEVLVVANPSGRPAEPLRGLFDRQKPPRLRGLGWRPLFGDELRYAWGDLLGEHVDELPQISSRPFPLTLPASLGSCAACRPLRRSAHPTAWA